MALVGDLELRPQETSAVGAANSTMDEARLLAHTVVACLCRDKDDTDPEQVKRAVYSWLGVWEVDIKVVRHKPEDFLIEFERPHHRDTALDLRRLPVGNIDIRIMPWRVLPYGDHYDLRHPVTTTQGSSFP
ncbi:unnamed protein product [Miscanthus lutarioriparius]|uniref:Uncharacterized protein n=1 Tax=Miscanthus lutarioriparius TaxID=422564 RepID=A0A811QAT5_9POAL|nr:unnamed protein product [Miscanthus lutarioriparius]